MLLTMYCLKREEQSAGDIPRDRTQAYNMQRKLKQQKILAMTANVRDTRCRDRHCYIITIVICAHACILFELTPIYRMVSEVC